jgi:hypothetical protein
MLNLKGNKERVNEALREWDQVLGMFNGLLEAGAAAGGAAAAGAVGAAAAGAVSQVLTDALGRHTDIVDVMEQTSSNLHLSFLKSFRSMYFTSKRDCYPVAFLRNVYHTAFGPRGAGTAKALSAMMVLRQIAVRESGKTQGTRNDMFARNDMFYSVRGVAADGYMLNRVAAISTSKFITEYMGKDLATQFTANQAIVKSTAQSEHSPLKVSVKGGTAAISAAVKTKLAGDHLAAVKERAAEEVARENSILGELPDEESSLKDAELVCVSV